MGKSVLWLLGGFGKIRLNEKELPCYHDISIFSQCVLVGDLSAKTIEGLSLTLEGIDNIHGSYSLTTSMLGVGDRVMDDILKEDLEHTTSLLVYKTRDTFDTTTTSQTADNGQK